MHKKNHIWANFLKLETKLIVKVSYMKHMRSAFT